MNDKKLKKRLTADTIDAIPHHLPGITGSVYSTLPRETFLPGKDTRRWPILVAAAALCVVTLTAGLLAFFPPPSHSPVLSNYSMDINRVDKIILWTHESERQLTAEETSDIISQYNASEYGGKATGEGGTPDFGLRIFTQDGEAVRMNDFYGKFEVFTEEGTFYLLNEQLYQFIKNLSETFSDDNAASTVEKTLRQALLNRMPGDWPEADPEILTQHYQDTPMTILGETGGYTICSYPINPIDQLALSTSYSRIRMDGLVIKNLRPVYYYPSPTGLYAVGNGQVWTVEEACQGGRLTTAAVYALLPAQRQGGNTDEPDSQLEGMPRYEARKVVANLTGALNTLHPDKPADLTLFLTHQGLADLERLQLRREGGELKILIDAVPSVEENSPKQQTVSLVYRYIPAGPAGSGADTSQLLDAVVIKTDQGWKINGLAARGEMKTDLADMVEKYCDAVSRGDDETVRSLLSRRALSMPRKVLTAPVSVEFTSYPEPVINQAAVTGEGCSQSFVLTFNSPAYFSDSPLTGEVQLDFRFVYEGGTLRIDGLWDIQGNPLYP